MTIVGIAGSLRAESYNKMLLKAGGRALSPHVTYRSFDLGELPMFNADAERAGPPPPVETFKELVRGADGLLVATPEYNQGLPAVTKNAIDWLSRRPKPHALEAKPVGIRGATPGRYATRRAQADLRHLLSILGAHTMLRPWLMVPSARDRFGTDGTPDDQLSQDILAYSASFVEWVALFS